MSQESHWDDWLDLLLLLVMIAAIAILNRLGRLLILAEIIPRELPRASVRFPYDTGQRMGFKPIHTASRFRPIPRFRP